jgi:molecular chaperone DnaK (HSP70)
MLINFRDLDPSIQMIGQGVMNNERSPSMDPQKHVSDFLKGIGEHLLHVLRTSKGKSFLRGKTFEFVITVPAIWTELATQRTIEACRLAGEPFADAKIHVVSEPEAAASE